MKAYQLLQSLYDICGVKMKESCDSVKAGCPEKEARRVAVCFIATKEVVRQAVEWGTDVLITHEPTYYNHSDQVMEDELSAAKARLVEESGLAVLRLHDHMHRADTDLIHKGFMEALGIPYSMPRKNFVTLKDAMTPVEIALKIKEKLGLKCVRLAGNPDFKTSALALSLGECSTDDACERLKTKQAELIICGEVCEWRVCEYVRDAALFGLPMAVLVLGHEGSERDGMKYLSALLADKHQELSVRYFESEEVYEYI